MKKVMCISKGKQNDGLKVMVGNTYTVIGTVSGGEVGMYHRADDIFYLLAELGNEHVFWDGLFANLQSEDIVEEQYANTTPQPSEAISK